MNRIQLASILAVGVLVPAVALAQCPAAGSATAGCDSIVTINHNGSLTIGPGPSTDPYDAPLLSGGDDNLVGVINNGTTPLSSITLTSGGNPIFEFDGDGIDTFLTGVGNASDETGYGGPDAYFTNISADYTSGTVNFLTPLSPNGGTTYFSLEEAFEPGAPPITGNGGGGTGGNGVTPEPGTLMLFGTGILGLAAQFRSRFSREAK